MSSLRFFRKKTQFKEPPKVLVDSSFISNMKAHKKTRHHVSDLLTTGASLYTTDCVAREILASDGRRIKALNIRIIGCNHMGKMAGSDCLLTYVEGTNESGYFVGTADEDFVTHLHQLPWVPVIQFFGSKFCLRKPSDIQIQYAEEEETVERGRRIGSLRGGGGRGLGGGARGHHGGGRGHHGGGRGHHGGGRGHHGGGGRGRGNLVV